MCATEIEKRVSKCIKRRANGSYFARVYLGKDHVTGKKDERQRELKTKDYAEAYRLTKEWLDNLFANPRLPVALEEYAGKLERMGMSANTVRSYRSDYGKLSEYLSHICVKDLTTADVNNAYDELLNHGRNDGERLSNRTVRRIHASLRSAYRYFMSVGLADRNPTVDAMLPPMDTSEAQALDEAALKALVAMLDRLLSDESTDAQSRNVAFAAKLALKTGVRVGEACGLRRSDVHTFPKPYIHVWGTVIDRGGARFQPKTKGKKSRNIPISSAEVDMIREHERWQDARMACGPDTPLVSTDGSFMSAMRVSVLFKRLVGAEGLPSWVHFHTLRHTHATYLLQAGTPTKNVTERLGHADVATTLRIYGHVIEGGDASIPGAFNAILDGIVGTP